MRVGIIGDSHEPVSRVGYLDFCTDTFQEYHCDTIVHVGDVVDWHGISFHARQPECPGVKDEFQLAYDCVQKWKKRFPVLKWCIGNHDERPARLARTVNIPEFMLKPYNEIWDVPEWEYDFEFIIDDVLYKHGTGTSGVHPAWNLMNKSKMSVVMGHCHSRAGVKWSVNPRARFFAVDTGCGVDDRTFQFAYGRHYAERSVLSCAVIDDGQPISIAMKCGTGEKYHDSRFAKPGAKKIVPVGPGKPTTRKAVEEPVHQLTYKGSPFAACNLNMGFRHGTLDGKVTCGNCRRTKLYKERR